jgi:hypothetical protein
MRSHSTPDAETALSNAPKTNAHNLEDGRMFVRRWSPRHGLLETSRTYP